MWEYYTTDITSALKLHYNELCLLCLLLKALIVRRKPIESIQRNFRKCWKCFLDALLINDIRVLIARDCCHEIHVTVVTKSTTTCYVRVYPHFNKNMFFFFRPRLNILFFLPILGWKFLYNARENEVSLPHGLLYNDISVFQCIWYPSGWASQRVSWRT